MRANVIDFPATVANCETCPWARSCVAAGLNHSEEHALAPRCSAPVKRGSHIVRQGDRLECLYVLRAGSAKSYFDSTNGLEQIVAFHYPGELLGFDAVADGRHQSSVTALETAALCRIPFSADGASLARAPQLVLGVMRAAARQMGHKDRHALLLGQKSAAARFASLLLDLSAGFAARGCAQLEFNLSMPRQDIANYLSLAVETVSRLCSELQLSGAIEVDRRRVRITSLDLLRAIAEEHPVSDTRATSG